jgi:valyl-tRNA synthetase
LPHISEEIYQNIYRTYETEISICETNYPDSSSSKKENEEIKELFEIVDLIRKFKAENNIKYSQENKELKIYGNKNEILKKFIRELKAISRVEKIIFETSNESKKIEIII